MVENKNIIYKDLSYKIIELALEVHNELGCGFLEKVYENALAIELRNLDLNVAQQLPISVQYQGQEIGHYNADLNLFYPLNPS